MAYVIPNDSFPSQPEVLGGMFRIAGLKIESGHLGNPVRSVSQMMPEAYTSCTRPLPPGI